MSLTFNMARKDPKTMTVYDKGYYPPEFDDEFKEEIRKRDSHECALCPPGTKHERLDVHHINYTKYTVRINCISLCRECHKRVHMFRSERATWAHRLYQLTMKREKAHTMEELTAAWRG